MNIEPSEVEKINSYFLARIESDNLNLDVNLTMKFTVFVIEEIEINSNSENILLTIELFSTDKIRSLIEQFKSENEFDNLVLNSFQKEKRNQLKNNLIQLEMEWNEINLDEAITSAFQLRKRHELKKKLQTLEIELGSKAGIVIALRPYYKAMAIAASIVLVFIVWQPQNMSNEKLFAEYSNNIDNSIIGDFTEAEIVKEQLGVRGEEYYFKNFTIDESLQLEQAITLIRKKEFEKAERIFSEFKIEKEKNPGLSLFLAIAQLNSGNAEKAKENLEYLLFLPSFGFTDEVKLHLAFAYLKLDNRDKAKVLLNELISSKSKFADEAKQTLKRLRWF